jgi:hypothetical protein
MCTISEINCFTVRNLHVYITSNISFNICIMFNFQTIGLLSLALAIAGPEFAKDFHGMFEGKIHSGKRINRYTVEVCLFIMLL